jgi:hypothetical protein
MKKPEQRKRERKEKMEITKQERKRKTTYLLSLPPIIQCMGLSPFDRSMHGGPFDRREN